MENKKVIDSITERGELVVALDANMPGYFVFGGETYGYQYDVFKAYASYLGVKLSVIDSKDIQKSYSMIENGEVDFIASLTQNLNRNKKLDHIEIYNTSYVLLCDSKLAAKAQKIKNFSVSSFLAEGRILVSSGFKASDMYGALLDSLPASEIYVSSRNSFELIEQLGCGDYDFLICELSEAQLGCALTRNVTQIYSFTEPISMGVAVDSQRQEVSENFTEWLNDYRRTKEYAVLNYLYFEKGIVRQVMGQNLKAGVVGGISVYDDIFKDIAEREGYDWRFISAIAYSESRFNPNVVSGAGAKGLMQIMPSVARQFTHKGDLLDPKNSVLMAVRILGKIEKSLEFDSSTSKNERMKIVLACYNAGIGHILDARNLARKYNANPDSWSDVAQYLTLKADPEVAREDVVKCGRFNSRETLSFVNQTFSKYQTYCNNISR